MHSIPTPYAFHIPSIPACYFNAAINMEVFNMGFIKRAFLYVAKKRGKSALLFIILLVMATFVLTGLSIEKATRATQDNLRYALGGDFEMAPDYSENNPY